MAAYGAWSQPTSPQGSSSSNGRKWEFNLKVQSSGSLTWHRFSLICVYVSCVLLFSQLLEESFVYIPPPGAPQQSNAGPKPASHQHKKHGAAPGNKSVILGCVDIPVSSVWPYGGALCLSAFSAIAFICALVFHAVMFYFALETPTWVVMCWPFLLVPPIIYNSIYLSCMAKRVSAAPNTNMVYLYVIFAIAYMAWAAYVIATSYKEERCDEASYYSLVVSVLALATVACALEWWLVVAKIMQHTSSELNVAMVVHNKSPIKRKLVITLKNNGKIVKESTFNLEKFVRDNNVNSNGQHVMGTIWFCNSPVHYGNEKQKQCPMKNPGQCSADVSQFNTTACHYENEKLKQDWCSKYTGQRLADGTAFKNDTDKNNNEKLRDSCTEECETKNSSLDNNGGQKNNIA